MSLVWLDPCADDALIATGQLFDFFVGACFAALGYGLSCGFDKRCAIVGGGAEVQVAALIGGQGVQQVFAHDGVQGVPRVTVFVSAWNWMRERSSRWANKDCVAASVQPSPALRAPSPKGRGGDGEEITHHLPPERFFEDGEGGQGVAFGGG